MHGITKIELTNAAISEALQDYLQKLMPKAHGITVREWVPKRGEDGPKLAVEFEQTNILGVPA
jgi:hypothetical protein